MLERLPVPGRFTKTVLLVLVSFIAPVRAQTPTPDTGDVGSIDAILKAVYDVISGPAGEQRDWNRFRALFLPEARLMPAYLREGEDRVLHRVLSPEDYIVRSGPTLEKQGFYEREIHRVVEQFGPIAQVFSTYESRRAEGEQPFARGINSFQLFYDGTRWWIASIFWTAERADLPIPDAYLP